MCAFGVNERKTERGSFQDFLSEGKAGLNFHLKRGGI